MVIALVLFGCEGQPEGPVDVRVDDGEFTPPAEGGLALFGAETTVEPYSDVMLCRFGTYTGPDAGITATRSWQAEQGHHVVLLGIGGLADQYSDDTVVDCTATNSVPMVDMEPIVIPTIDADGTVALDLPDGVAAKLREGQRYIVQSHYINTGADPILVRDVLTIDLVPEDDVVTWAAPMALNASEFVIPAGQDHSVAFDCTFDDPVEVLFLNGHMHEWGTSFRLDQVDGDALVPIYEVPDWDVSFRDTPPTASYAPGEYTIDAGTTLRTTCNWHNDTDHDLVFPHEMCVTAGMIMPALTPYICSPE